MNKQHGGTTNTILVLLLVIVIGFVVWYVTAHQEPKQESGVQINLGGGDTDQK